jgi:hypothetical protein
MGSVLVTLASFISFFYYLGIVLGVIGADCHAVGNALIYANRHSIAHGDDERAVAVALSQ